MNGGITKAQSHCPVVLSKRGLPRYVSKRGLPRYVSKRGLPRYVSKRGVSNPPYKILDIHFYFVESYFKVKRTTRITARPY